MERFEYPALYRAADDGSNRAQGRFLLLVRSEYALLILVACLSQFRDQGAAKFLLVCAVAGLGLLVVAKVYLKLDQNWYKCRALAESVKTSAWRFVMRAHPFEDAESIDIPRKNLRNYLRYILGANDVLKDNLSVVDEEAEQISASMIKVRSLPLKERVEFYQKHRIKEQRRWYTRKARSSKNSFFRWICFAGFVYFVLILAIFANDMDAHWLGFSFDPFLVLATAIVGWLQVKRFGELAASYNLTAQEIGLTEDQIHEVEDEKSFSEFVNETELAFSREHTQWAARREAS